MFERMPERLSDARFDRRAEKAINAGKISLISDEVYDRTKDIYLAGVPVYFFLKYMLPVDIGPGKCWDAAYMMAPALASCDLVCADSIAGIRRYNKGAEGNWHYWLEKDGIVYDAADRVQCPQDTWYYVQEPVDVRKTPSDQLDFSPLSLTFKPEDVSTRDLIVLYPQLVCYEALARATKNRDFSRDIQDYEQRLGLDQEEVLMSLLEAS